MTIEESPTGLIKASIEHLLKQGRPAFNASHRTTTCRYRDNLGNACAIGGLIPDERYDKSLEGSSLVERVLPAIFGDKGSLQANLEAYKSIHHATAAIQSVHDTWAEFWRGVITSWDVVGAKLANLEYYAPGWREAIGKEMEERFLALLKTRKTT